jgi:putative ABC transport system permease protein
LQDLRFALRTLRNSPVFSLTVVLVLALGIGSTALILAIVNASLIQGPPFPESSRLFMLWGKIPQESEVSFSPKEFTAWQKQTQTFETLAAFTGNGFAIYDRGEPEMFFGQWVTPALFHTLRVAPALGRVFLESEAQPGHEHVVILSDDLWRAKFGARPDVLGQTVKLNGTLYTVVGVMPKGFAFPRPDVKLWAPLAFASAFYKEHPDAHFLRVLGRLKPRVTEAQLRAETDVIGSHIVDTAQASDRRFYTISLAEQTSGELRRPLVILLAAVVLLLAIACANVANLMLARGPGPGFGAGGALGARREPTAAGRAALDGIDAARRPRRRGRALPGHLESRSAAALRPRGYSATAPGARRRRGCPLHRRHLGRLRNRLRRRPGLESFRDQFQRHDERRNPRERGPERCALAQSARFRRGRAGRPAPRRMRPYASQFR